MKNEYLLSLSKALTQNFDVAALTDAKFCPALFNCSLKHGLAPLLLWALKQRAAPLHPTLAVPLAPLHAQARQVAAR